MSFPAGRRDQQLGTCHPAPRVGVEADEEYRVGQPQFYGQTRQVRSLRSVADDRQADAGRRQPGECPQQRREILLRNQATDSDDQARVRLHEPRMRQRSCGQVVDTGGVHRVGDAADTWQRDTERTVDLCGHVVAERNHAVGPRIEPAHQPQSAGADDVVQGDRFAQDQPGRRTAECARQYRRQIGAGYRAQQCRRALMPQPAGETGDGPQGEDRATLVAAAHGEVHQPDRRRQLVAQRPGGREHQQVDPVTSPREAAGHAQHDALGATGLEFRQQQREMTLDIVQIRCPRHDR